MPDIPAKRQRKGIEMYESEYCRVDYMESLNAVLCQWKRRSTLADYRNPLRYGLRLLNEKEAVIWITDTTNGFECEADDMQWLQESFLPRTIESPCQTIVFILNDDSILKAEVEQHTRALSQYFNVEHYGSLEELMGHYRAAER